MKNNVLAVIQTWHEKVTNVFSKHPWIVAAVFIEGFGVGFIVRDLL